MSLVLNVEILGEFKKLTAATNGAAKDLKGLNGTVNKISKGMKTALGAIGLGFSLSVVTAQLKEASKAAIDDQKSQALLENQLKNTTNATDAQIAAVEKSINKMQFAAGVADDDLRPAFAQLTRATGDTAASTKLLELALDISAGSGKGLESVTMALTKAYNGQFGALTKLGVPMTDQIANANDFNRIQKELNKALDAQALALSLYGPNSEEFAKASQKVAEKQDTLNQITAEGVDWQGQLADAFKGSAAEAANIDPYNKMQVIFGEMQEQIGAALLPLLVKFSTWLSSPGGTEALQGIVLILTQTISAGVGVIEFIVEYRDVLIPLVATVGALTLAWKAYNVVSALSAASTTALGASMKGALGPLTAVVAALQVIDFVNSKLMANGGWERVAGQGAVNFSGQSSLTNPGGVQGNMFLGNSSTGKPTVINNITVNSASTNASGIVSSLQGYQNQNGSTIRNLLK
jgi:hypothetical protein